MSRKKVKKNIPFFKITLFSAFISSLCCFAPIIFVFFGLASISTAAYWGNYFFFGYWWLFIAIGLFLISVMLTIYWRKNQVCTLDAAKRHRRQIINSILISLILFIILYLAIEMLWEIIWIKMGLTTWESFSALFQKL